MSHPAFPIGAGRSGKRALNVPAEFNDPSSQDTLEHAKPARPVGKQHCFASVRQRMLTPAVGVLNHLSCPTNVPGLVVPIVVDAVDGVIGTRPSPNIMKESREGLGPFKTDRNPATSIVLEAWIKLVRAAVSYATPDLVLRHLGDEWSLTAAVKRGDARHPQASARVGVTAAEIVQIDPSLLAAIASTKHAARSAKEHLRAEIRELTETLTRDNADPIHA